MEKTLFFFNCGNRCVICLWGNSSRHLQHSASQVMRAYSIRELSLLVTVLSLTHVWNYLQHTYIRRTQKNGQGWEPAAKSWSHSQASWLDSNNQMALLGLCLSATRWQWDGITFFRLTDSNPVSPHWQTHAITRTPGGLQISLCPANKMQLVGHTSCQTTHIVLGLESYENLSNSIV